MCNRILLEDIFIWNANKNVDTYYNLLRVSMSEGKKRLQVTSSRTNI